MWPKCHTGGLSWRAGQISILSLAPGAESRTDCALLGKKGIAMFTREDREKWKALIDEGNAVSKALRSYSHLVTHTRVPGNGPVDQLLIDIMRRVSEMDRRQRQLRQELEQLALAAN
jgi:hypothetical protein